MRKRGFSIIENLISLALGLLVLMAVFEVFGTARSLFLKLKKAEEEAQAAMACLDKMRIDLFHAGTGLSLPIRLGLVDGLDSTDRGICIFSLQESYAVTEDLLPGTVRIPLKTTAGIASGREICILEGRKGERNAVSSCRGDDAITLTAPLAHSYQEDGAQVLLLEKVTLYLDEERSLIRRRVNASSPQPLLEDVHHFDCDFGEENNLVRIRFALKANQEKTYELLVFPKNTGLCSARF